MPICRLQKNHALSRRGGPTPALLPHPSPTPNDASKAKQRKVYTPEKSALSRSQLFLSVVPCSSSFHPFLFLPFSLSLPLPRRAPISFALFLSSSSHAHQLVLTLSFVHLLARSRCQLLVPPIHSHCLCLSFYPTYIHIHIHTHLLLFLSFRGSAHSLAHMRANEID